MPTFKRLSCRGTQSPQSVHGACRRRNPAALHRCIPSFWSPQSWFSCVRNGRRTHIRPAGMPLLLNGALPSPVGAFAMDCAYSASQRGGAWNSSNNMLPLFRCSAWSMRGSERRSDQYNQVYALIKSTAISCQLTTSPASDDRQHRDPAEKQRTAQIQFGHKARFKGQSCRQLRAGRCNWRHVTWNNTWHEQA